MRTIIKANSDTPNNNYYHTEQTNKAQKARFLNWNVFFFSLFGFSV